jgi:hypothetical protein
MLVSLGLTKTGYGYSQNFGTPFIKNQKRRNYVESIVSKFPGFMDI